MDGCEKLGTSLGFLVAFFLVYVILTTEAKLSSCSGRQCENYREWLEERTAGCEAAFQQEACSDPADGSVEKEQLPGSTSVQKGTYIVPCFCLGVSSSFLPPESLHACPDFLPAVTFNVDPLPMVII